MNSTDQATQAPPSESAKRQRASTLIAAWIVASRILGFVRESLIASLGVGAVAGALTFAFAVPNLFRRLFGEGALTAVFLPQYTRTLDGQGENAARLLVSAVFGALLTLLGGITLLVICFCLLFPRDAMPASFGAGQQLALTLDYLVILFPYVVLVCAYALAMAVLNANGKFLVSAAAPAVQNAVAILGLGIAVWLGLGGVSVGYVAAWFFLFSGVVQFGMQLPGLAKTRMLVAPSFDWQHPGVKSMAKEMAPLILGLGLVQVNLLIDQWIAVSYLGNGGNQYISMGSRLLQLPIGILGASTVTVLFPVFSRLYASGSLNTLRHEMDKGIRSIAFLAIPAGAGLAALAYPITKVLFEHGQFTAENTAETAPVVAMYSIAIPALCIVPLITRVFYAAGDTRLPVKLSAGLVFLNIFLSLILVQPLRAAGIALATTIVSWANLFALLWFLKKLGVPKGQFEFVALFKMVSAAVACGLSAYFVYQALSSFGAFPALVFSIGIGAATYFAASSLLQLPEAKNLLNSFRRKS